jgi:hypothetical protein
MSRCENSSHIYIRIGAAAVWAGIAGGVVEKARTRSDVPGFVARALERASNSRSWLSGVLCADAHGSPTYT